MKDYLIYEFNTTFENLAGLSKNKFDKTTIKSKYRSRSFCPSPPLKPPQDINNSLSNRNYKNKQQPQSPPNDHIKQPKQNPNRFQQKW